MNLTDAPRCKYCLEQHWIGQRCNTEEVAKMLYQAYWCGVMDGGMDRDIFEDALVKGEGGELDKFNTEII